MALLESILFEFFGIEATYGINSWSDFSSESQKYTCDLSENLRFEKLIEYELDRSPAHEATQGDNYEKT